MLIIDMPARITFNANSQKRGPGYFESLLSPEILLDICRRITGQDNYELNVIHDSYNKGRLIILDYNGARHYVTLSEVSNDGRNSSVQSVPTAINIFYADLLYTSICTFIFCLIGGIFLLIIIGYIISLWSRQE